LKFPLVGYSCEELLVIMIRKLHRYGILLILAVCASSVFAQVIRIDSASAWRKKLIFNVNVNQASFSSNWKAGGVNSIGFNGLFQYQANYTQGNASWDNNIDLAYGFVNNAGQGYRKTIDRVFLDTKYGYKFNPKWSFFTSLNFLSQFANGYRYQLDQATGLEQALLISDIFAPAFITSAWGVEYHPAEYFKLRLSPFAPRLTIVNNPERFIETVDPAPYGVIPPDNTRFEWLAFQLLADFNKDIATNLSLKWRYLMFANYETLELKTIDHRVDLNITAKVSRFFNVGLGGILVYDYDQDSGAQFSQVFNFGFSYTFQNFTNEKK
jgi:hypothetical protein